MEPIICAFTKTEKILNAVIPAHFEYTYRDGELLSQKELDEIPRWTFGRWPSGTVTYEVDQVTDDFNQQQKIRKAVGTFFQMVEPFIKDIEFTSLGKIKNADIPILFKYDDDYLRATGRNNVVAYTTMPVGENPRNMKYADRAIVFDDDEDWTPYGTPFMAPDRNPNFPNTLYKTESVVYTGGHELLHKLGLPHGTDGIMHPYVPSKPIPIVDKQAESRVYEIYGRPNIFARKMNRMRQWRLAKAGIKSA